MFGFIRRFGVAAAVAAALVLSMPQAGAQPYPVKPVRVVDAYPPGGTTDWLARLIGPKFVESKGQPWTVENRPGAQGIIGIQYVAKAPADGYTLLMFTASQAIHSSYYKNLPYDLVRDFAPITLATMTINVLLVHPTVPARNVRQLIALAKARPGQLEYASAGLGSQNHLAVELLKFMTGTDMTHIPYKSTQSAVTDILSGRIAFMFGPVSTFLPHIQSGRIRPIAIGSAKRSNALPDVPTVAESGVPGYQTTNSTGVLAPAGTPKQIVSELNTEIVRILNLPDVRQRLIASGAEPLGTSAEEFGDYLRAESAKWGKLIKDIKLTPQQW
ncbi:MAG: tripartite tricarboxylate transporter substrate binding protein [Burkholderiales bacterium]|nr:tripartite tricarboxylate transporter substrate binding protein [Burkholderiales bacterium]